MSEPELPTPVINAAKDTLRWLKATKTPHAVIGALAVSMLTRPRFTRDVDFMVQVEEETLSEWVKSGREFGVLPRIPDADSFAVQSRIVLMIHGSTSIEIDLALIASPFEEQVIANSKKIRFQGLEVKVPAPRDLVVMKAVAGRPQDMVDIDVILDNHPKMPLDYVRKWVDQFAELLENPDIPANFEQHIVNRRRRLGLK